MADQGILHIWECTAASHCGVPRGTTRNVLAGSDVDKRYTADPAWKLRGEVPREVTVRRGGEASSLLEQARAALEAGNRSGALVLVRRATRLLEERERDTGVLAERAREERGERARTDRTAEARRLAEQPLKDETGPARTLTKTELTRANKAELLIALREASAYVPGMEAKSNDELRATLRDAYGYEDGGGAEGGAEGDDEGAAEHGGAGVAPADEGGDFPLLGDEGSDPDPDDDDDGNDED